MSEIATGKLTCGAEWGVSPMAARHVVAVQIRFLAGSANDPESLPGLAKLVEETLDKATGSYSGRQLSDAFDAIGASRRSGTGRETATYTFTVLPEHFERAVELHAEFLRRATFPNDAVDVNLKLARQELHAIEDDAQSVLDRVISRKAYGPRLGRHPLGETETLDRVTREHLVDFWTKHYRAERMIITVAGAVETNRAVDVLERQLAGFGGAAGNGRAPFTVDFSPGQWHHQKDLEQEHIGVCWPGVAATHDDFPVQLMVLGMLSGGMSGRLFTEVREKLGLVYWVAAWQENPRGAGMIFLGASTTPERCDKTYATLLREVDRLAEDIEPDELNRAITGALAQRETRGDSTRAHCGELSDDLFHFGRPIPEEEKIRRISSVTVDDVRRYLATYPRSPRCVVTLGPRSLSDGA